MLWKSFLIVGAFCLFVLLPSLCLGSESFYDILGVPNDADTRTIRKAFKKLAISKHPDKNKDDPNAHDSFVRITRAYEVLKDEEMRKKYDEHGEAGLDSNFQPHQQYQSWQFYRDNFGIYDDNIEIVTLSRADFEEEVINSDDFWFINFYSTLCSHCHTLAPTWREFAKSMDGIIRIGAVNCAEDPMLCQSQHVRGYPSLVAFPKHIFYQGPRDTESLTNFIVSLMITPIHSLTSVDNANQISQQNNLPFFVEYCDEVEDCMPEMERKKVASMLSEIANFGVVSCTSHGKKFCSQFLEHGFAFYPLNGFDKEHEKEITFSDLKELYAQVLLQIEDIEHIDDEKLRDLLTTNSDAVGKELSNSVVIFFENLDNLNAEAEYKKLKMHSAELKVYFADCSNLRAECYHRLHLNNLPRVVLFRSFGGFDIHYGRKLSLREVRKFVQKSLPSSLISLTDESYHDIFHHSDDDIVLIDHFAPWCPPCLRLIPELRKLPNEINGRRLRTATLNCEAYKSLCADVNSYPTTSVFANSNVYTMIGYHNAQGILEFIEESLSPTVHALNYESFQSHVVNRPRGHLVLVDFFAPWCGPCQQLAPEFRKLARLFRNSSDLVSFASVDCDANRALCVENSIRSYPAIRLFDAAQSFSPKEYPSSWWRDHNTMRHWLNEQLPSLVERITGDFHTNVLGSSAPILVDFYAPWCGHCIHFAPILENIAKLLEGKVRVAKVNCDVSPYVCQIANVQAYPSLRLYLGPTTNSFGIQIRPEPNAEIVTEAVQNILVQNGIGAHDEL